MSDFTADQIKTFRTDYIRDLVDTSVTPSLLLSHFNKATGQQFVSDTTINNYKARVENDLSLELNELWNAKRNDRLKAGDADSVASAAADSLLLDATFRLVRAEVTLSMMRDPGYVGSIADKKYRDQHFDELRRRVAEDRNFVRNRAGRWGALMIARL